MSHLVRVGLIGHVGRFRAVDRVVYARGARVVVRTSRGLEVGEVLASPAESGGAESAEQPDGELLRRMTPADDLLEARLERHKCDALDACERRIAELQLDGRAFLSKGSANDEKSEAHVRVEQAYVDLTRFAGDYSLRIGRQSFADSRSWWYD